MKKKTKMLVFGGLFILIMASIMFNLLTALNSNSNPESEKGGIMSLIGIETKGNVHPDNDIKDVEKLFPLDMNEIAIQNGIHYMSHQKIIADEKWRSLEMTQERVQQLLKVVEQNPSKLEYGDTYLEVLTRWTNGDFTRIVEDHNMVWRIQNGSVGKAVRKATSNEEDAFVKANFR